ncbi:hypothetical protein N7495_004514 [Penicillium taxi]|uniref:uncharacterized protein n=1 Tax=Penicillium taxi TaxID=168475 RepID=UPI00254526FA|nr:uncharacterized protein N7495_004514 [Penicillium taxi]KAJ5899770.1 hypothetical protein N7495_004514 [Penicillium taxi]
MSTQGLIAAAQGRRTIYQLGKTSPVDDAKIEELVNTAILNVPSSFNTQSTRLVVLLREEHEAFWQLALDTFPEGFHGKLNGFKAAFGTVLFFEDPAHIKGFQDKFPAFADSFPIWADHSNAMHQYFLWSGLESLGFGANLQHYNSTNGFAEKWSIPADWRLIAQLVFGNPEGAAGEKTQKPVEERVKFYGKQ